ncbi:MAG: thrombospondin type 3 repeat-containing protein, partial [Ferruginibacter sp.]
MKQKLTLFLCFAVFSICSFAQSSERFSSDKKGSLLGIHFDAIDFKTPLTFKNANSPRIATNLKDMDFGASVSYWKGLTSKVDFTTKVSALFHDYKADQGLQSEKYQLGLELEPTISIRPFGDNHTFNPFLTAGLGGGYYMGDFGAYVPAGVGLQFNFMSTTYLFIQANYRFSLTKDNLKDNILYSIGFAQSLTAAKPKMMAPPPPPVVLDRDNDGVVDSLDRCPDTPGLASLQGCPDRDGDGIADIDDKCPDVAGIAKYQGCPIPDTDGDGINDEMDKCPTVKGLARYQGCPIPDTDGDGVNDEEDKCPTRPGPVSNQGCPVIAKEVVDKVNFAAKNVFFSTGS